MCWSKHLLKTWAKFKPVTRHHSWQSVWLWHVYYIYIYAFSRRFYPKRLTLHSSYSFTFYQLLLSLGIEPMILALLVPCSTIWATGKLYCHYMFYCWSSMIMSSYFNVFAPKNDKDLCWYRPKPHFARSVSKLLEGSVYRGRERAWQCSFEGGWEKQFHIFMPFLPPSLKHVKHREVVDGVHMSGRSDLAPYAITAYSLSGKT